MKMLAKAEQAVMGLRVIETPSLSILAQWWVKYIFNNDGKPKKSVELASFLLNDEYYRHEIRAFDVKHQLADYFSIEIGLQATVGQFYAAKTKR